MNYSKLQSSLATSPETMRAAGQGTQQPHMESILLQLDETQSKNLSQEA